jgi:hypothetical protein
LGSLEKRLEALEAKYPDRSRKARGQQGGGHKERLAKKFVGVALSAISHIRREVIDLPQFRYRLDMLHEFSTFKCAAYVAALASLGHEDEAEARAILLEKPGGDSETLEKLISIVVALGRRTTT